MHSFSFVTINHAIFNIKYSFRRTENRYLCRRLNVLLLSSWSYILTLSILLSFNKNGSKSSALLSRSEIMSKQFVKKFITNLYFSLLILKIRLISSFFFNLFDVVFTLLRSKSIYNLPKIFSWRKDLILPMRIWKIFENLWAILSYHIPVILNT